MAVVAVWLAAASLPSAAEPTLVDAAERGDRAAALRLLSKGANPNAPGADGSTAIMYAAANDDLELVRALIKAGANVKAKNQFGTTAMTEAAIIGSAPVVGVLLMAGALVRPVSVVLAAHALVAYVLFAAPRAVWPIRNGGIEALLYVVVLAYFAVAGPGAARLVVPSTARGRGR